MNTKKQNWQQDKWPNFSYDKIKSAPLEQKYIQKAGISFGIMKSILENEQKQPAVELISDEALNTSEIEGEIFKFLDYRFWGPKVQPKGSKPLLNNGINLANSFSGTAQHLRSK